MVSFFWGCGGLRDLHSFPTRRSSDLGSPGRDDGPGILRSGAARHPRRALDRRSEEHTSELQSRQYLVCRLLLEKKKSFLMRWLCPSLIHLATAYASPQPSTCRNLIT